MPCHDGGYPSDHSSCHHTEMLLSKEVDQLTRMLCSLCRLVDGGVVFPHNVGKWWEVHEAEDTKRMADNKVKAAKRRKERDETKRKKALAQQALAKLSDEEAKALLDLKEN